MIDHEEKEPEWIFLGGLLGPEASFRILVRGDIGAGEVARLIEKLELDLQMFKADEERDVVHI